MAAASTNACDDNVVAVVLVVAIVGVIIAGARMIFGPTPGLGFGESVLLRLLGPPLSGVLFHDEGMPRGR